MQKVEGVYGMGRIAGGFIVGDAVGGGQVWIEVGCAVRDFALVAWWCGLWGGNVVL